MARLIYFAFALWFGYAFFLNKQHRALSLTKALSFSNAKTTPSYTIILADSSSSVRLVYPTIIETATLFYNSIASHPSAKAAVLEFATTSQLIVNTGDSAGTATSKLASRKQGALGDATFTHDALMRCKELFADLRTGLGFKLQYRIILLTNGAPSDENAALRAAEQLKALDVEIFAIGFGSVNQEVLDKLASPGKAFGLSSIHDVLDAVKRSTLPHAQLKVVATKNHLTLTECLPLAITVRNLRVKGMNDQDITKGSLLYFGAPDNPNAHFYEFKSVPIPQGISPGNEITFPVCLQPVQNPSLTNIPQYIELSLSDNKGQDYVLSDNVLEMQIDTYSGELSKLLSRDYTRSGVCVAAFGFSGAGKSSFWCSAKSSISQVNTQFFAVGGGQQQSTMEVIRSPLTKDNLKIGIDAVDTVGVTLSTYDCEQDTCVISAILNGSIPILSSATTAEDVIQEMSDETRPLLGGCDVALFVIAANSLNQERFLRKMQELYILAKRHQRGYNPPIVVTKLQYQYDNATAQEAELENIAALLGATRASIFPLDKFYKSDMKDFVRDKQAQLILHEVAELAYLIRKHAAETSVPFSFATFSWLRKQVRANPLFVPIIMTVLTIIATLFIRTIKLSRRGRSQFCLAKHGFPGSGTTGLPTAAQLVQMKNLLKPITTSSLLPPSLASSSSGSLSSCASSATLASPATSSTASLDTRTLSPPRLILSPQKEGETCKDYETS